MTRPEQLRASKLPKDEVEYVLEALARVGTPVRIAFRWRPRLPDPGDDMVLETAMNGRADAIVTFNTRHFAAMEGSFRCALLSPAQALQQIREIER